MDYKLDLCAYCDSPTWCFQLPDGPICRGCHVVAYIGGVLYDPLGLKLLWWQEKILRQVYGTVNLETGERQFWKSYNEICAKNGKSALCGALPLYHLDAEPFVSNAQAFGMASAQKQAGIVYRAAAQIIRKHPQAEVRNRFKVNESTYRIVHRYTNGYYRVISADGGVNDGEECSLAIYDELHRWHTKGALTLYEVMNKGTVSVPGALSFEITTAGAKDESPICYRQHERAIRILRGQEKIGRLHVTIYAADEARARKDPDYLLTREARVAANPSHEDLGGFLKDERITAQREEIGKAAYERLHLGIWGQKDDRWLESGDWEKGNLPTRPLVQRRCYLGLDLSSTTAMTALVALFPDDSDGSYDALAWFWVPKKRVKDLAKRYHVDLEGWIDRGLVTATPGDAGVVDYDVVSAQMKWCRETFHVQENCYDPWNATDLITKLEKEGLEMVKIPQTISHLTAAMKHIQIRVREGRIRHGGNEVLAWHANAVVAQFDSNKNCKPKKPDEGKDSYCIDGFTALLNAMVRGMISEPAGIGSSFRSVSA